MDADEARMLQAQLKAVQRRLRRQLSDVDGLSGSQARVLGALARVAQPVMPSILAIDLEMATSNLATVLGELEAMGYVRRTRNAADKRRVDVELTASGRELVDEHIEQRTQWLRTAIEATCNPAEQRTLRQAGALLARVAAWGDHTARRA